MNIKRALVTFLRDSPAVTDITGGRIFPQRAPQGLKLPYVTVSKIGGDAYNDIPGEAGCRQTVLDVTAYASDDSRAEAITEAIRNRISGYRGEMDELFCHTCSIERPPIESTRRPRDGSDSATYLSSTDYRITHSQAEPDHT